MRKSIPVALAVFALLAGAAAAQQIIVLKVKVQVANVRSEPVADSAVVKQISMGTLLEAKSKLGDWYEILVADKEGNNVSAYIHSMVVDVIGGGAEPAREPERPVVREEPRRPIQPEPVQPVRTRAEPSYDYGYGFGGGLRVLGGLASSTIATSSAQDTDLDQYKKNRMGFLGGIGYELGSGRMGVEIDVMYIQKGVKYSGAEEGISFSVTDTIGELSVPVLFKLRFMPGSTPYVFGGGEIAYVLSNEVKYTLRDTATDQEETGTEDVKDSTNEIDYGVVFGAGYEMRLGGFPLSIEARYHLGLADLAGTDPDTPEVTDSDSAKTRVFVLAVGFRF